MPSLYLYIFTYALFPNRKAGKTFGADLRRYGSINLVRIETQGCELSIIGLIQLKISLCISPAQILISNILLGGVHVERESKISKKKLALRRMEGPQATARGDEKVLSS